MKLHTIKLEAFQQYAKFQEFISHLETIPSIVNFVVEGGAVILEFNPVDTTKVYYYYSKVDNIKNNPIIALGRDCEASTNITAYDVEKLELKSMVSCQDWI